MRQTEQGGPNPVNYCTRHQLVQTNQLGPNDGGQSKFKLRYFARKNYRPRL